MRMNRIALLACLAAAGSLGVTDVAAASSPRPHGISVSGSRHSGAAPARSGSFRSFHPGSHRPTPGTHWGRGYRDNSHWGWGLGLAIGVPWALGWYDPYWGPSWGHSYYPPYAYGPPYRSYGYACEQDEDCWRERVAPSEPAPPTTEVAPAAPGEEGGPTQRPLHLNYCDSAKAWFPHVRTCPGGWRVVRPEYTAP